MMYTYTYTCTSECRLPSGARRIWFQTHKDVRFVGVNTHGSLDWNHADPLGFERTSVWYIQHTWLLARSCSSHVRLSLKPTSHKPHVQAPGEGGAQYCELLVQCWNIQTNAICCKLSCLTTVTTFCSVNRVSLKLEDGHISAAYACGNDNSNDNNDDTNDIN